MFNDEFNIIPLIENGKKPLVKWQEYQKTKYTASLPEKCNYAVICGKISNNLLIFDLDLKKKRYIKELLEPFKNKYPLLFDTLIISTPHGYHLYYFTDGFQIDRHPNKNAGYNKKNKFTGFCVTNFEKYLKGFDILGNNGYAIIPPSIIGNLKYEVFKEGKIRKISEKDFENIKNFFLKEKPTKPRLPFLKILNGEIDIENLPGQTGKKEFTYWKYLFCEVYNYCGLEPQEIYTGLKHNQSSFNQKACEEQFNYDYNHYTNKPMTNKKMIEFFPDYKPIITEKVEKTNGVLQTIEFNACLIKVCRNDVIRTEFKVSSKGNAYEVDTLILDGNLDILFKTTDISQDDLFTFTFKNKIYRTLPIEIVLKKIQDQIYLGSTGRDIIKRIFNYVGDQLEENKYKDEYILGFNNGWKLPQNEKQGKFLLVIYTDYQNITYENAIDILKNYTIEEKEDITNNFKDFLERTQVNPLKQAVIIGWAMASPFRLSLINELDIFPILYLYGIRHSGKSQLEKFYITDFFNIYERSLSPNTLESPARFEDHLSESTFAHNIQEIDKVNNTYAIPLIKDHATFSTHYERKKNARELDFRKQKTAGLCLDSNVLIEKLKDFAANSKVLLLEFSEEDKVNVDDKWKQLFKKLTKEKLFSFIYEYTKDWRNKDIFHKLKEIKNNIKRTIGEHRYERIDINNPRLLNIYQIILFGLELFEQSFNIDLEDILEFNKDDILEELLISRQVIPSDLRDKFIHFCLVAKSFDEGYTDEETKRYIRGTNPKFLTNKLRTYKKVNYVFTQDNLRDFNEYLGNKESYNLKSLSELLFDSLMELEKNNNILEYTRPYIKGKQVRALLIDKNWLDGEINYEQYEDNKEIDPDKMEWRKLE